MKHLIYILLLVTLFACEKSKVDVNLDETLCNNKKALLSKPYSNWEISLDTIKNIDDYIKETQKQLKKPLALENIQKTKYGMSIYSNIHPYLTVEGVDIGLFPLIRNTGGGWFSLIEDSSIVVINDDDTFDNLTQEVFDFYINYQPNIGENKKGRIIYPRVDITVRGANFYKIKEVLKKVSFGYLKAAEFFSQHKFSKKICDLNENEFLSLKKEFALNVRLFKYRS